MEGGSKIFVDKQDSKRIALGFCGLVLKYWI
jgi:hypothetical protein